MFLHVSVMSTLKCHFSLQVEAKCRLCNESFTAHRYLFTHLADVHFHAELEKDLPQSAPWKCPMCVYSGQEPRALRVHYGVRHKIVLNHLAKKLGVNLSTLKKQMKEGRKKAVATTRTSAACVTACRFCAVRYQILLVVTILLLCDRIKLTTM